MTTPTNRPPYEAYAAIMGTFVSGIGLAGLAARSFARNPACRTPLETGDLRQAIGELVTCSRCGGAWAAAGLAVSQVLAPRSGRLLMR